MTQKQIPAIFGDVIEGIQHPPLATHDSATLPQEWIDTINLFGSEVLNQVVSAISALEETSARIIRNNFIKHHQEAVTKAQNKEHAQVRRLGTDAVQTVRKFKVLREDVLQDLFRVTYISQHHVTEGNEFDEGPYTAIASLAKDVGIIYSALNDEGWSLHSLEAKINQATNYSDVTLVVYRIDTDENIVFFEVQINTTANLRAKDQETQEFKYRKQLLNQIKQYCSNISSEVRDVDHLVLETLGPEVLDATDSELSFETFSQIILKIQPDNTDALSQLLRAYVSSLKRSRAYFNQSHPILSHDNVADFIELSIAEMGQQHRKKLRVGKPGEVYRPHEYIFGLPHGIQQRLDRISNNMERKSVGIIPELVAN